MWLGCVFGAPKNGSNGDFLAWLFRCSCWVPARRGSGKGKNMQWLNRLAVFALVLFGSMPAWAQVEASNYVGLVEDNITNARTIIVPLGIGASLLFLALGAVKMFWRRTKG